LKAKAGNPKSAVVSEAVVVVVIVIENPNIDYDNDYDNGRPASDTRLKEKQPIISSRPLSHE
jgi:hypothetical protein